MIAVLKSLNNIHVAILYFKFCRRRPRRAVWSFLSVSFEDGMNRLQFDMYIPTKVFLSPIPATLDYKNLRICPLYSPFWLHEPTDGEGSPTESGQSLGNN